MQHAIHYDTSPSLGDSCEIEMDDMVLMTRQEQMHFVRDLVDPVCDKIIRDIEAGKVPCHWYGMQLRMLICDRLEKSYPYYVTRKEISEFKRDCAGNNL